MSKVGGLGVHEVGKVYLTSPGPSNFGNNLFF